MTTSLPNPSALPALPSAGRFVAADEAVRERFTREFAQPGLSLWREPGMGDRWVLRTELHPAEAQRLRSLWLTHSHANWLNPIADEPISSELVAVFLALPGEPLAPGTAFRDLDEVRDALGQLADYVLWAQAAHQGLKPLGLAGWVRLGDRPVPFYLPETGGAKALERAAWAATIAELRAWVGHLLYGYPTDAPVPPLSEALELYLETARREPAKLSRESFQELLRAPVRTRDPKLPTKEAARDLRRKLFRERYRLELALLAFLVLIAIMLR